VPSLTRALRRARAVGVAPRADSLTPSAATVRRHRPTTVGTPSPEIS